MSASASRDVSSPAVRTPSRPQESLNKLKALLIDLRRATQELDSAQKLRANRAKRLQDKAEKQSAAAAKREAKERAKA